MILQLVKQLCHVSLKAYPVLLETVQQHPYTLLTEAKTHNKEKALDILCWAMLTNT